MLKRKKWLAFLMTVCMMLTAIPVGAFADTGSGDERTLVCGLEESAGHTHDESCVCPGGELICGLEEGGHVHNDACFTEEQQLICTSEEDGHEHAAECYTTEKVLNCGLEETEHVHSDACYCQGGEYICELEESEGHVHTETCYEQEKENESAPAQLKGTQKLYSVGSTEELQIALDAITSGEDDAEIQLTANVVMTGNEFGIEGKHITVTSSEGNIYTLSPSSGNKNVYLIGDITFENVKISATSIFAQGNTMEFGENYTSAGLRLYGGSDRDLDLTTNGDEDGSTHIIIRNGSFVSIVGGNKDTFDQGEYHEYADWSDPETNIHTTLTGNVKIDIYGGRWGSGYNIDVGDTCCNTSVTPVRLYGGGLGSDTVGDITINVYDVDTGTGYNDNIVGGGFGMAGGEDDTTVDNDAIKHTGVVYGNVNLNLLGGYIAPFYGGGYHGGSAFKPSYNVTGERFNQSKYHRDKVAVVTGDVNIVMGGDMTLCQNTAEAWGGSYASTIGGDLNITIKDNAKLAAKYALNNGGAPIPQNMNDLINTYGQYYDGMYPGYGWSNRFYITGQYDIIKGNAILNIEGGYVWEIDGTIEREYGNALTGVKSTEVYGSMDINISGGMVNDLWGDYYGESIIKQGINVNMTGGEVNVLTAYDGRNDTLATGSQVSVDISGGTVYALRGSYYKIPEGITSSLSMDSTNEQEDNTLNIGYIEGFSSITVKENANVLIDAVPVVQTIFGMPVGSYGEDRDLPFYRNVIDLTIEEDATLTTCKNETNISGNLVNTNGTWIANGRTNIGQNADSSEGKIFFKEPSIVQGNAVWDDTLLCLPVVQQGSNYDGMTNTDIALTVGGLSTGAAKVRTVNKEDHTQAVTPTVGDNYVLSQKNADAPAESVYTLENAAAVANGLYLKRVNDPADEYGNFMWQVAKDERIIITPTSVTLYTGGKGYDGVVIDDEGHMSTGAENGIPEPGFLLTLPDALQNIDVEKDLTLQYDDGTNTYKWGFEKYGDGDHNVYRIIPIDDTQPRPIRIELTQTVGGETIIVDSDDFTVDDYFDETLDMTVYGDSIEAGYVSFVYDGRNYPFVVGSAKLTVRATTGEESYGMLTGEIEKDEPHITAEAGTYFTINNSNVQVDDASGIALLFDDIIEKNTEGKNNTQLLKERTDKELESSDILSGEGTRSYDMKYLDLVDTNNGNVWVKAVDENGNGRDITVYWPLPDGTDQNTEFELLHFEGLHREMGTNVIADLIEECTVESMDIKEVTDTHVVFNVGSGGFSPFVLVWEKTDSGSSGGGGGSSTKYYTLHYESNGGTEYDDERYKKNTVVDLDKVPVRMGYTFTGWYADEELTEKITEIKMTSDKTVYAGWVKSTVPDQLNGDDHFAYVVGYPDGSVQPNGNITRAEVAAIFFRLLQPEVRDGNLSDTNVFTDVTENDWHNVSVSTMAELNIIKGRTETTFVPDAPITRAEFAAICARFDTGLTEGDSNLTDISGHWAEEEIERAVSLGWIAGYPDGTFKPNQFITRAEAVSIINRVLCRMPEEPEDLLSGMNIWPDNMDTNKWYYLAVQEATNSHTYEHKGEIHETWLELTADPDWSRYNNI